MPESEGTILITMRIRSALMCRLAAEIDDSEIAWE
jgi:hypothetical protein